MRKITFILMFCSIMYTAKSQDTKQKKIALPENRSGITIGENYQALDRNNVSAGFLNRGDMFWNLQQSAFEVPKTSGKTSIFAGSLWLGGLDVNEQLHGAFMKYRSNGFDYFTGPLKVQGGTTDSANVAEFNRIWKIDRAEIENFKYHFEQGTLTGTSYSIPNDILTWPAHGGVGYAENLAPFVDINQDGQYNPYDGDYPQIKGDQMLWWIFNDNYDIHTETNSTPMGVEVQASAYSFVYNDAPNDSIDAINNTIFLELKVINRSDSNYNNVYIGFFTDFDIGNPFDDFIGSHVALNSIYGYNGEPVDGDGNGSTYGDNPPAQSATFLKTPENEGNGQLMSKSMYFQNGNDSTGDPETGMEHYNLLQGKWKNGTPLTYGGTGYEGTIPCDYMFPDNSDLTGIGTGGQILDYWSEIQESNAPGDRRGLASAGPFELASGQMEELELAFVWARGDERTNSLSKLFTDIANVTAWYNSGNIPSNYDIAVSSQKAMSQKNLRCSIYPNPANNKLYVKIMDNNVEPAQYEIYTLAGKLVANGNLVSAEHQTIDISAIQPGMYLIKIKNSNSVYSLKLVKE